MNLTRSAPALGLGLLVAWGLKSLHGRAGVEELTWILAPTCRLAGLLSGIEFVREAGAGWIDHTHRIIVGASCSGVNFLVISFLTLCFSTVPRAGTEAARWLCLGASLGVAWALTIATNATRIVLAMRLFSMDIYGGTLTPGMVHRAAGALVYCLALLLAHATVERTFDRWHGPSPPRRIPSLIAPFGWYLGLTLGLPLANRAWQQDPGLFLEHSVTVVSIGLLVAATAAAVRIARTRRRDGGGAPSGC